MRKTVLFLASLISFSSMAQKSADEKKGDRLYYNYTFDAAIEKYNASPRLTREGKKKLAESYCNIGRYAQAENIYAELTKADSAAPEDYFNYASVLRRNGKPEESDTWMKKFYEALPSDSRGADFSKNAERIRDIMQDEGRYKISDLDINTAGTDFGAVFYQNKIVFTSTRQDVKSVQNSYNWNGMPFLDMYVADLSGEQIINPRQLSKKLNHSMHEGPASFTADGNTMAFTCNNYNGRSKDDVIKLQIFFAEKDAKGEWSKVTPFKLNSAEYSVGYPCLSKDGKTMYFSSDKPGGIGGVDIYRIEKSADDTWGDPVNLGKAINTEGNEMFPFFHEQSKTLFFSSNGHFGIGGLDLFSTSIDTKGEFSNMKNMGIPLNTRFDDFALILDSAMTKGYFSSNREGGKGDDDIYYLQIVKQSAPIKIIRGVVRDNEGNIIKGVLLKLKDKAGNVIDSIISSENGMYEFKAPPDQELKLEAVEINYLPVSASVNTRSDKDEINEDVVLIPNAIYTFQLIVSDSRTKERLNGVRIQLKEKSTGKITTNDRASDLFHIPLPDKKEGDKADYEITLEKAGYLHKTSAFTYTFKDQKEISLNELIDLSIPKLEQGVDLGNLVHLKPIYFDLGKSDIRKDAAVELEKIVSILNDYPGMTIEIGSHTDCRSSAESNAILSEKRASSSVEYIQKKISNPERVTGKGYGETRLKNDCACEGNVKVPCTEAQHQENRRTEFIILKVE